MPQVKLQSLNKIINQSSGCGVLSDIKLLGINYVLALSVS